RATYLAKGSHRAGGAVLHRPTVGSPSPRFDRRRADRAGRSASGASVRQYRWFLPPDRSAKTCLVGVARVGREGGRLRDQRSGGGVCAISVRQFFRRGRVAAVRDCANVAWFWLARPLTMQPAAGRLRSEVTVHAAWGPGEVRIAAVTDRELIDYAL